jgi:hypothetical protein
MPRRRKKPTKSALARKDADMAKSRHIDRAVRIELLRARAALEREALVISVVEAGQSLTPRSLFSSIWPRVAAANGSRMAMQAFGLLRRYPMVGSSLSALAFGGGKKTGVMKAAGGALLAWRLFSAWRGSKKEKAARRRPASD